MATCLSQTGSNTPTYFDSLGTETGPYSGQGMRSNIYQSILGNQGNVNAATDQYVKSLQSAATDPNRAKEMSYEQDVLGGKYLNGSPALDEAMGQMRAQSNRSTADTNAKTRSTFAQNGMGFGTGAQEAELANGALNTSQANATEASTRLQNYQTERGYQQAAPQTMESLIAAPSEYYSKAASAYYDPLNTESQIVQRLSGGGTVATPSTYQTTSGMSQVMSSL